MRLVRNIACMVSLLLLAADPAPAQSPGASIREGNATVEPGILIYYLEAGGSDSTNPDSRLAAASIPLERATPEILQTYSRHRNRSSFAREIDEDHGRQHARIASQGLVRCSAGIACATVRAGRLVTGRSGQPRTCSSSESKSLPGWSSLDSPVSFGPAEIEIHREFARIILSGISVYAAHPAEYSEGMVKCCSRNRTRTSILRRL
jgi:hypothetical protein